MSKQNITWFIHTGGNGLADAMIADTGKLGPDDECREMLCTDGHERDLWRCPDYEFVRIFEQAAQQIAPVSYKIFCRKGQHGQIRERGFDPKHNHRLRRIQRPIQD